MNPIELIICILLLLMVVPDLCRRFGRPALSYAVFVIGGILVEPLIEPEVALPFAQAGQVGFLLLLFEVGLEIDLPSWQALRGSLRPALWWIVLQYPLVLICCHLCGLHLSDGLMVAAALTACSVGMAHRAWKAYPGLDTAHRASFLQMMILLETVSIIFLSLYDVVAGRGLTWRAPLRLAGIVLAIWLIGRGARHLSRLFLVILEKTTKWRVHLVILLVLLVCAVGERLGLSGVKTAFFLGLFLSRIRHDGKNLEEYMAPISRRLLIPIFFFSLGLHIEWHLLASKYALIAAGVGVFLLGYRSLLHRRVLHLGGDDRAFLLLCPNLPIVALAADLALLHGGQKDLATGLVVAGLAITIPALLALPPAPREAPPEEEPVPGGLGAAG